MVKDLSFVVFLKYQGKALKYYFCSHQVQIYFQVIPKAKNEVGNHPRHDAILAADLHIAKTWILQSRFPMLVHARCA